MINERITLDINIPAPTFDVPDIFEKDVNLKEYYGKRVMIAFFRHVGCPFCNIRVQYLKELNEELKAKGLYMIFFFESSQDDLLSSEFHRGVSPIPLISDPEKKWYDAYGVESSGKKSTISHITSLFQKVIEAKQKSLPVHWIKGDESIKTIPAEFLVDEKGMVKKVHYAKGLTDRMSKDAIVEFAETGSVMDN